jgi:hypothetical protein
MFAGAKHSGRYFSVKTINLIPECFAPTVMTIKLSAVRAKHSGNKVNVFTDQLSAVRAKHSGTKVNVFTDKLSAGMLRPYKVNIFTHKLFAVMLRPYSDLAGILLAKYHSPPSPVSWAIKPTRCKANVKA